jgi:hypothetical protein
MGVYQAEAVKPAPPVTRIRFFSPPPKYFQSKKLLKKASATVFSNAVIDILLTVSGFIVNHFACKQTID